MNVLPVPPHQLLSALACPDDHAPVVVASGQQARCSQCGRVFSNEGGIFRMLPAQRDRCAQEVTDTAAEREQRDREAHRYDAMLGLRLLSFWELPATLRPLQISPADRVLEVGCGTGRFSARIAREGGELIAVDHSLESLRVLQRKISGEINSSVLLVQGDATALPIRQSWASCALSCQMLEHLPSEVMRAGAVMELGRCLARGGRFALSGYSYTPALRWFLPREGKHSGKIFFHRFTRTEFLHLLERQFCVEQISGRLVYLLLAHGRKR